MKQLHVVGNPDHVQLGRVNVTFELWFRLGWAKRHSATGYVLKGVCFFLFVSVPMTLSNLERREARRPIPILSGGSPHVHS